MPVGIWKKDLLSTICRRLASDTTLKADIENLRLTGGMHRVVHKDYHRMLCKTFPFAIYYTKAGPEITIFAVVDCRRDPAWVRGHLRQAGRQSR